MFQLSELQIRKEASIYITYKKGCEYYKHGWVKNLKYILLENRYEACVSGNEMYSVTVSFDKNGILDNYDCDCPAFKNYDGACKHIIALMKAIQTEFPKSREISVYEGTTPAVSVKEKSTVTRMSEGVKSLIEYFEKGEQPVLRDNNAFEIVQLVPEYHYFFLNGVKKSWLQFTIGTGQKYVLKNLPDLMESLTSGDKMEFGKKFTFDPKNMVLESDSKSLMEMMLSTYKDEVHLQPGSDYYNNFVAMPSFKDKGQFSLSNTNLLRFFEIMGSRSFKANICGLPPEIIRIREANPEMSFVLEKIPGGIKAFFKYSGSLFFAMDVDYRYVYCGGTIYKTEPLFSEYIKPFLRFTSGNGTRPEISVPDSAVQRFLSSVIPNMERISKVQLNPSVNEGYYNEQLQSRAFFDKFDNFISVKIEFQYGEIKINPYLDNINLKTDSSGRFLLRSIKEENSLMTMFQKYGFEKEKGQIILSNEDKMFDFLEKGLDEIKDACEVYYSDSFKTIRVKNVKGSSASVRINPGSDLLEFSLNIGDIDSKELSSLMSSFRLKKRYHRLRDGSFMSIDRSEFESMAQLIDQLNLTESDLSKKVVNLPRYRAMYIDSLARENKYFHIERNNHFKKMVQDVLEPQDMEFEVPASLRGVLRDYQKTGFKWLNTLSYYGFGGILADDMGLGKTLQVIALVLSFKEKGLKPSLVIAPTSLVYNWQEEVEKFAPQLKTAVISGMQGVRAEQMRDIGDCDLVITSYALIKRDIGQYRNMEFRFCFIDEAQHIKNPKTLNSRSVKSIRAERYFALTGTPIENSLTELWSIFDFLMPGYLLSHAKFSAKYETPIIRNNDSKALRELGRHISPFILRRMKKDVLLELPDKIENKMICEMTQEQRKVYFAYLMQAKSEFESEIDENGFEKSHIKILALLTRLRQVCCHPSLFIEDYEGGSGKLDMLAEIVEDALEGGHRPLLFSQFTSMLAIIKGVLEKSKTEFFYLDGSTKPEKRLEMVNAFNGGEKQVFLISLKAGGTGLNLTGADMVIHYDPWWNPAVEDQATDRAYRIGQMKAVQVIKMITRGTIEEKIFELQQRKKELIDSIITPGENFMTKMNEAEIRSLFDLK